MAKFKRLLVAGGPGLANAGAETAESGVKRRRILRRFHPDVQLLRTELRSYNLGEMGAESGLVCGRFLLPSHPR